METLCEFRFSGDDIIGLGSKAFEYVLLGLNGMGRLAPFVQALRVVRINLKAKKLQLSRLTFPPPSSSSPPLGNVAKGLADGVTAPFAAAELLRMPVRRLKAYAPRGLSNIFSTPASDGVIILRRSFAAAVRRGSNTVRLPSGPRVLNASGMGLAAAITMEDREDPGILGALMNAEGPVRMGIGWLPRILRILLGALVVHVVAIGAVYAAWLYAGVMPWVLIGALVMYGTRPDLRSFKEWVKSKAPEVAARKTEWVDKVRARIGPFLLGFSDPDVRDFSLFTVITLRDVHDFMYLYFGILGRWYLLGWWDAESDYDFDKIRAIYEK